MLLSFYLRFNNNTRCAPDEHQTPVVRRLQQDGHLCAWWRPGCDIHAKLIVRAKFSGPASRLGEGIGQPPHSAACLAGIPRINWGFSLQLNRFKILINTDATGPRCSYELSPHSTWMQACGCHWWVPSTWRGVRLGRVSLFLRKWNLDVVDCCARSQVGTNSMSEPLRIGFWYWYSLSGSSCPVPAWGKTPWREFVVSGNLLKECLLNSQQWFISATLGICRDEVKTFYMHPLRNNIYQQTRYVRDFSTR